MLQGKRQKYWYVSVLPWQKVLVPQNNSSVFHQFIVLVSVKETFANPDSHSHQNICAARSL